MVFADDPTSHLTYTVLPLFISACSCLLAATLALSSFAFHEGICTPIAKYTLVGSCCMLASCTGLWYIRQRYRTLHLIRYLIPWVLGAVFALLLPLGSTGYAIYGLYTLFDDTSGSSINADICNSSVIYYPAWIVIIATFILTLIFFPIAAKIIISRLLFMKPDSWWSDYEEHIDNIRWLRTSLGDLIPTLLVRSPNKNPKYTIIYSHGNASDLGIMIQGLLHLAKHVNCHIIVYDYPGYGLAATTGYLDEQHIYASIEAVYRATLCSQQNIWGEELPADIILFGRSLGTAVSIHLAALLGDAERFGRYNGDITGTRGNRAGAVGEEYEGMKEDDAADTAEDLANPENKGGDIGISINSGLPPRSGVSVEPHVFPHSAHAYAPGHGPNNLSTIASSATPLKRPTYIGGKQVKHPERLCGVILDSPLTSIVRTKLDIDTTLFFDMFVSIDKIHRVTVPVRITHGTEDTVVPKEHAQKLIDRFTMPDPFPAYWLQDKGHNDLPKFWLYHTNKVKDLKERARLDKLNEETTQYLYNLRRFLQHCDAVSVYYSEVEPTEPTSIGSDDDILEEEEEDAENAAVEALAAAARHNKRTKDAVATQRSHGHGHGHRLGRAQEEASPTAFSEEEDDGLLSLPPDVPIPRLALPFTSSNSNNPSNSTSHAGGPSRGEGIAGAMEGENTLPLSPVYGNVAVAPADSASASARGHVANKPTPSPSPTASASTATTGMGTGTSTGTSSGIVYPGSSFARSPSPAPTARGGVVAKTPVQVAVNSARGRHRVVMEQEQQLEMMQGQVQGQESEKEWERERERERDNSRSSRVYVTGVTHAPAEGDEEADVGARVGIRWEAESEEEEGLVSIVVNLHESGGEDTIVLDDEVAHHRYV